MRLAEYLEKTGVKINWLAKKAKITRQTISKAVLGLPISFKSAQAIEKATEGKVAIRDLIPKE